MPKDKINTLISYSLILTFQINTRLINLSPMLITSFMVDKVYKLAGLFVSESFESDK